MSLLQEFQFFPCLGHGFVFDFFFSVNKCVAPQRPNASVPIVVNVRVHVSYERPNLFSLQSTKAVEILTWRLLLHKTQVVENFQPAWEQAASAAQALFTGPALVRLRESERAGPDSGGAGGVAGAECFVESFGSKRP